MTNTSLHKLTGAALIGSFVLSLAGGVAHPIVDGQSHSVAALTAPASPWAQLLIYAGALLLMVGLPGMFVWLRPHVGRVGMIGIALYFLGNALSAQSHLVVEAFVAPAIAADPAARHLIASDGTIVDSPAFLALMLGGALVFQLGLVLTGIGLFRSGVVSRWVGVLVTGGALLTLVPLPEIPVVSGLIIELPRGLAVAIVGYLMIRAAGAVRTPATRELVTA
ncbi:hypothetical protein [Spirilliplanes yamanashiensis]|uniref:DUF4386 family protein n=1 Tax=Spirilliplanes yamanashiensis TaxID=42233 RepID=A0A8J3YB51_9ACTN|nr:hypothetical protein [Spirilliplanes yamanashiensis]MDP9819006.1 hypothetical protein [Spirilliplanes yamanashiensis]GIJ05461.1 hypothetical protein Sya03_48130 [Spirilliplanes yamanashiensis]